ncbi:MAG: hypothetical protein IKG21_00410 [Atopobiaceae bacterium]|nr:hypothetical protein [Atopobiaceae bacterium]
MKGEDGGQSYAIFFVRPAEWQSGHAGSDAPNYHVTYVNGRLGIDQKPVTITADDLTKTYGDETPELTATVDGAPAALVEYKVVLDPDDPNNAPDKVENAGEHRLVVEADVDQGSYKVEVRAGKLTIEQAPVTVRADDASKVYDNDPANPDGYAATVGGLKRGDDESVLTYQVGRAAGEDVGTYAITPTGEESQGNYTVKYEAGTFTISARTVTARGFKADDKEYDGTTDATVSGGKVYDGDTEVAGVTIDAARLSGEFADRHAGDDKTVAISGIGLTGDAAKNYALDLEGSQTKALASISPRPIKVTADDVEKTYGDEDPASYTATVTYDGDADPAPTPVVVTGDKIDYGLHRSVESHNGQFDPVSEYVIYVTGSQYQGDYKVTYANGRLKVNRREITLARGVTATSKTYDGDADATATLDLAGAEFANTVNGDKVTLASATGTYVEQGTETANKNAGPRDVLLTGLAIDEASARNYVLADAGNQKYAENGNGDGSDLQIVRRKVKVEDDSITVRTDGSRTYDATAAAALDLATATFDDVVEGETVTLRDGVGTGTFVNDEGEPDKNVGEGKRVNVTGIELDDGNEQNANYELVDAYPAEDAARSVAAVTHGDITPLAVKVEGIYAKTREYDGTDVAEMSEDSNPTFVTKASDEDDLSVESATIKFQGKNAAPTVEQYGMVTEIVLGGADAANYSVDPESYGPTRGKIVPREIDVTADDKQKVYGEDDPELTVTYTHVGDATQPALVGEDELVLTTLAREAGEDVDTYKITVAGNEYQSGDKASPATPQNYHVHNYSNGEYGPGTLTITARPVVVSIDTAGKGGLSKTYGEDDPELRAVVAYDGDESRPALVRGDELDYAVVRVAGEDVRSGGYAIRYVDSQGADKPLNTPVAEGNYLVTYVPSTLVIETKEVRLRIDDKSKAFGAEDPKWTVTYVPADALVWRRDLGRRDQLRYTVDRVKGEDGGQSYALFFVSPEAYQSGRTGSSARNYHVTYVGGRLAISRRSVTVTADSLSKAYGAKDPTLTAKVAGVTKGDSITYTLSRAKGEDVGTYTITPKGERVQGSYVVTYKTGKLTINQANVTVKADDLSKSFGDKDPRLTATVTGTKKGETVKYTLKRAKGEAVGKYKITVTAAASQGNYRVTAKGGTLTIGEPPTLFVAGEAHCQNIGWVKSVYGGDWMGTTGQSKRMEAFTAKVEGAPYAGGITYRSHVQTTGWQGWVKDGDLSGTWGQSRRLEATQIKLYGELARRYDVYYRVHAQTYGWLAWAKNGEMSGTAGQSKRLEAMQIVIVRKGAKAPGASYHGVVQQFGKAFIG